MSSWQNDSDSINSIYWLLTEVIRSALPPARPLVAGGRVTAGELWQLGLRLVGEEELEQLI